MLSGTLEKSSQCGGGGSIGSIGIIGGIGSIGSIGGIGSSSSSLSRFNMNKFFNQDNSFKELKIMVNYIE